MKNNAKRSKQVADIKKYIFANPAEKTEQILDYFETKWNNISRSTIKRRYYEAAELVDKRIRKQEKVEDEVLVKEAKEAIKKDIADREETLKAVTRILRDNERKAGDIIQAAKWLADVHGWNAPVKTDITTDGMPINEITIEFV